MTQGRLWSKEFIAAIVVNLFMSSVFFLLSTTMAGYAVEQFRASDSLAGLASSGFILGAVVSRMVTGKFLDFIGRRRLLLISMVAYTIIGLAYIPVDHLGVLIALRLLHGVAFGVGHTALVASVQSVIPPAQRAEGNGYFATATTLSTAVGPFLAVWLSQQYGFEIVFALAAGCGAVALIGGWFYTVPERTPSPEEYAQKWSFRLGTFFAVAGMRMGLVIGVAGFAYASVLSFLAVHASQLGVPEAASAYFIAYAATSLIARLVAGRIQDRFGDNIVVIPVLVFFAAGMVLIGIGTTPLAIIVAGGLIGVGFGSLLPALLVIVVGLAQPARVGVVTSTFYLFLDFGSGVGPIALGFVATAVGFPAMFLVAGGLTLVAGLIYLKTHGLVAGRGGAGLSA